MNTMKNLKSEAIEMVERRRQRDPERTGLLRHDQLAEQSVVGYQAIDSGEPESADGDNDRWQQLTIAQRFVTVFHLLRDAHWSQTLHLLADTTNVIAHKLHRSAVGAVFNEDGSLKDLYTHHDSLLVYGLRDANPDIQYAFDSYDTNRTMLW